MTGAPSPTEGSSGPGTWVMVLLAARFFLELALLCALVIGALSAVDGPDGWLLALSLVLGAALLWGAALSPRRRVRLALPLRVALELGLFVGAAWLLAAGGHPLAAGVLLLGEVVVLAALGGPDRHAAAFG